MSTLADFVTKLSYLLSTRISRQHYTLSYCHQPMMMCLEISAKIVSLAMLVFQGSVLDIYLVKRHGMASLGWVVADILVLCSWILSVFLGKILSNVKRRCLRPSNSDNVDGQTRAEDLPDELPFAYFAWVTYVTLLAPRIIILFSRDAEKLKEEDFFGPNFLKVAMACTPMIFILLVQGHHDARPHTARRYYIERLIGGVAFDLFDSADLLQIVFENRVERIFPSSISDATLAFATLNLFLPTLALYELRSNKFNGQVSPLSFKLLYVSCFVFLVNFPNLIIRSIIWHRYNADVSVLLMKNVMCIMLGLIEFTEYADSDKPLKCRGCGKWFLQQAIHPHQQCCTKLGPHLSDNTAEDTQLNEVM